MDIKLCLNHLYNLVPSKLFTAKILDSISKVLLASKDIICLIIIYLDLDFYVISKYDFFK